jgi:NACHT domain
MHTSDPSSTSSSLQGLAHGLPEPLVRVVELLGHDDGPFRRVHRLIDAFEVLVKLHTVAVVSDYFARDNLSPELKAMLGAGLRTPSLGIWWLFCREIACQLDQEGLPFFAAGARDYILTSLLAALDGDASLIAFRNKYAHGATPSDTVCQADLDRQLPRFRDLLRRADHLRTVRLELARDRRVFLAGDGPRSIDLHPLLVYKTDEQRYYFFNDVRKPKATFLNYEHAQFWRSREYLDELLERYQIDEWSRLPAEQFRERIENLTETFKGRRAELAELGRFLTRPRGLLMVWGGPGVGKSALLAQAVREFAWGQAPGRDAGRLLVLEYFIRRGQRTDQADFFLANVNRRLEELVPTSVPQGRSRAEQWDHFAARLPALAERLAGRKLLLVIDGLDEACGADNDLLRYLPRSVPAGVLVLYAARPVPEVRRGVADQLDREYRAELTLSGLTPADTRALLYDHVSKYALEERYIAAVAQRSGGNPLFLKLVCLELAGGALPVNDLACLPASMAGLYDELLARLRRQEPVLDLLLLLATVRAAVSPAVVALVTGWPSAQAEEALAFAAEVLVEQPASSGQPAFLLFHESLREYLRQRHPEEVLRWDRRLADWCGSWESLSGPPREYALEHGMRHLEALRQAGAVNALPTMQARVRDAAFRAAQFQHAGLQTVLDDLQRVARATLLVQGTWPAAFDLLLIHANESQRLLAAEMTRLPELARSGRVDRVRAALGKERNPLARFLATLLAAWELADAGRPFLETLLEARQIPGVALPARATPLVRQVLLRLQDAGLAEEDAERLLGAILAGEEK